NGRRRPWGRRRRRLLARCGDHVAGEVDLVDPSVAPEPELDVHPNRPVSEHGGAIPLAILLASAALEREPVPAVLALSSDGVTRAERDSHADADAGPCGVLSRLSLEAVDVSVCVE